MDLPKHFVLDLNQIVRIEKVAAMKQRMAHILRARIEHTALP
jgi:hypothetical protein